LSLIPEELLKKVIADDHCRIDKAGITIWLDVSPIDIGFQIKYQWFGNACGDFANQRSIFGCIFLEACSCSGSIAYQSSKNNK
jgi:hypothetical protein